MANLNKSTVLLAEVVVETPQLIPNAVEVAGIAVVISVSVPPFIEYWILGVALI